MYWFRLPHFGRHIKIVVAVVNVAAEGGIFTADNISACSFYFFVFWLL